MKRQNKTKRILIQIFIIIVVLAASNWLILHTTIENYTIFHSVSLFTYFGVLIGFSLTIYTFGLSMISDIKNNIDKLQRLSDNDKKEIFNGLRSGFHQIKQDIWLIFWSIILVILVSVVKEIGFTFSIKIGMYQIPETINISLFFLSTIAMYDIMKTLFNLSEINMELIKENASG